MNSNTNLPELGSFRDPAGHVFYQRNKVYRAISPHGATSYDLLLNSPFIADLMSSGRLVKYADVTPDFSAEIEQREDFVAVLEHAPVQLISYPYEWPFSALRRAALFHLDIQLEALTHDVSLVDASPYNVQFIGTRPIFIDHLSFRPYRDGDIWVGHRQFCEQFLNPLLITAVLGVPYNQWYRGAMNGISCVDVAAMLPIHRCLSIRMLTHVVLPALFERRARSRDARESKRAEEKFLPKNTYTYMLRTLRRWIEGLTPKHDRKSTWARYECENSYSNSDQQEKSSFVSEFVSTVEPETLWDIGCNTGHYSALALHAGAGRVIGFDSDHLALEVAFDRANREKLAFTPLFQDFTNPSPDQGWDQAERTGLRGRRDADAVLALAIVHHLVFHGGIPLDQAVSWLVQSGSTGVIEFVPANDPMAEKLIGNRPGPLDRYSLDGFRTAIEKHADIIEEQQLTNSGRVLVRFSKR